MKHEDDGRTIEARRDMQRGIDTICAVFRIDEAIAELSRLPKVDQELRPIEPCHNSDTNGG